MWDKEMPANENVELLVEKLLDEEVARLMAANEGRDGAGQEGEGLDDGEEMVGGVDGQPSEEDALGLNRAKATVLAGEKITSQPQQQPLFNQINLESAANNARNNAYGKRYEEKDEWDDDFESTDRAGTKQKDLDDSWDGEF